MESYLNSPQYRQLLAMALQNPGGQSQYPGQAIANMGAQLVNAYSLKNYEKQQQGKEADYAKALSGIADNTPVDSVAVTPPITGAGQLGQRLQAGDYNQPTSQAPSAGEMYGRLLSSGNADAIKDFAPGIIKSQLDASQQANQPITPYQRANLGIQQSEAANQTRKLDPAYLGQVAGAEAGAKYPYEEKLAKIRSDAQLGSAANVQSVQQVQLDNGQAGLAKIYRNGKVEVTTLDGKPAISSARDPSALFNQRAASAGGAASGTAAANQPTVDGSYQMMKDTLGAFQTPEVKNEAGSALGLIGSNLPTIPGINSNFVNHLKQLQGQTFLQAYNSLKGAGAITEVEGEKATASIARLQRAQTTSEFYNSLKDTEAEIDKLYGLAKQRAQRGAVVPQMQQQPPQQSPFAAPQAAPQGAQQPQQQRIPKYNPATGEFE